MQTPTREERIAEYCRSTSEDQQMWDQENCDMDWLFCESFGGAVESARESYGPRNDGFENWEERIEDWRACAAEYPWGKRFVETIDQFLKAEAVEPEHAGALLWLAMLLERCDIIDLYTPACAGLYDDIETAIGWLSEATLPTLHPLLALLPPGTATTHIIRPLTKAWALPHSFLWLASEFSPWKLAKHCARGGLAGLQAAGVPLQAERQLPYSSTHRRRRELLRLEPV